VKEPVSFEPTPLHWEPGLWLWLAGLPEQEAKSSREGTHLPRAGSKQRPHGIVGFYYVTGLRHPLKILQKQEGKKKLVSNNVKSWQKGLALFKKSITGCLGMAISGCYPKLRARAEVQYYQDTEHTEKPFKVWGVLF